MVFPVQMWELDHKGWVLKNWCFLIVVLEKTLESPVDSKEIKPVNPKEIKSGYSLEGLTLKLQYFGHLIRRADLLWKASDAGIDWRQEEKGIIEDEMVEWHHRLNGLNGHEFEKTLGDSEGQRCLACCSPWGHRIRHNLVTERYNTQYTWQWIRR